MNLSRLIETARALKPLKQEFRAFHLAAIFRKSRLISIGTNTVKTHPFAARNGYPYASESVHAECLAVIRGRLEDYSGHVLVVLRIGNRNQIALSKPCKYCNALLTKLGFSRILYSDNSGQFIELA